MKKLLICSFALLLLHGYTYGQAKNDTRPNFKDPAVLRAFLKEQNEDVKNNAEFVFEGYYQRRDVYPRKDKNGKEYYPTCDIVRITKVFRGNLKPGTVELTGVQTTNGFILSSERESYIVSNSIKYIFFCRAAGKDHPYDAAYDIYPVDNKTILTSANKHVKCSFRILDDYMFESKMYSKGDVYRYIHKLPNIKMPVITREDTVEVSRHKAIPDKPLTQIQKDSLRAIHIEMRIRRADSIGRIKSDSIEFVKKKVKPLISLESQVTTEGVRKLSIEDALFRPSIISLNSSRV